MPSASTPLQSPIPSSSIGFGLYVFALALPVPSAGCERNPTQLSSADAARPTGHALDPAMKEQSVDATTR